VRPGDAPIFRNRSGAPYGKDTLGDDLRIASATACALNEDGMLGHDFCRSGTAKAIVGDASASVQSEQNGIESGNISAWEVRTSPEGDQRHPKSIIDINEKGGARDGARTRDLRRDRPAL